MEQLFEKLKAERGKIKHLKGAKKWGYIWDYYKPVFAVILIMILMSGSVISCIFKAQEKVILSVVVVDADREKMESFNTLEQNLKAVLGNGKKHERVILDTSATSNEKAEAVMNTVMKLSVAEDNDVVILNESEWEKFQKERPFADWKEILGDSYSKYESYISDGALKLSKSMRWNAGGYVQYEPAYLCVLEKSSRKEAAKKLVSYFFDSK